MSANPLVATLLAMAGQQKQLLIPRAFVRFAGSLEAAMMLNQLLYWQPRKRGEVIYKTDRDWADELCLTRYAVRKARECLAGMGFLTFATHHVNGAPAVHYEIDFDVLVELWTAWLHDEEVKSENELNSAPSKVRKRTLLDESNSNPNLVKFENGQTMNHRVPTEIHVGGGGGARALEMNQPDSTEVDPLIALFARYDITQAEPLARLYRSQWPDITLDDLTRLCERLAEPESGSYAGARLYRKLKAGPYERIQSTPSDDRARTRRADRQPDPTGTALPERGPVRTTLDY